MTNFSEPNVNKKDLPVKEKSFFSTESHAFNVGIAMLCGIEAALIYNSLLYWIRHNKAKNYNQINGKTWTYDTHEKIAIQMPYINSRQVKYALQKLVDAKIIIKDNFNKDKFNKTNWYALADESILDFSKNVYDETKLSDRSTKSDVSMGQNCPIDGTKLSAPQYTDTIPTDTKNTNSLKVLAEPAAGDGAAEAAEKNLITSKSSEKAKPSDFSEKVLEVGDKMISSLKEAKPDYSAPRNVTPFLRHIDFMIRLDKRDPQKILDVFRWALADSFWCDKMFKPNPAEYLRKNFDSLEMKMLAKPPQKERKFAPSSNDKKAIAIMEAMDKRAL